MQILFFVFFLTSCEANGTQIVVRIFRVQSPTVVGLFHCLKFWFLADSSASVSSKRFFLFLERQQRQHFIPNAVADLGEFYIPRVLQPADFVLCLT